MMADATYVENQIYYLHIGFSYTQALGVNRILIWAVAS